MECDNVLVQAATIEYCSLCGLNTYFSQFLRLEVQDQGSSRSVSGEDPHPGLWMANFSLCPEKVRAERECGLSIPISGHWSLSWGHHLCDLIISQWPYLLIPSHWRLRIQHMNIEGDTNILSVAHSNEKGWMLMSVTPWIHFKVLVKWKKLYRKEKVLWVAIYVKIKTRQSQSMVIKAEPDTTLGGQE